MENIKNKTEFDLIKDLFKHWIKHWYIFIVSFAVCCVMGYLYLKIATPMMSINSNVMVNSSELGGDMSGNSLMRSLGIGKGSGTNIEDESLVIASHGNMEKMIARLGLNNQYLLLKYGGFKKLDLYKNSPIEISYPEAMVDTMKVGLTFDLSVNGDKAKVKMKASNKPVGNYEIASFPATIQTPHGDFTFSKTKQHYPVENSYKLRVVVLSSNVKAQLYAGQLNIDFYKKTSNIITLSTVDNSLERGIDVLNEVINVYNREYAGDKANAGAKTVAFIDERLKDVMAELAAADKNVEEFKKKYKLTDVEADAKAFIEQSAEIQSKLIEAETQLSIIGLIDVFLSNPKNAHTPIPFNLTLAEKSVPEAISDYNKELIKRNNMAISSKDNNPMLIALDEQLKAYRKNIQSSVSSLQEGMQITVNTLKKKESEFRSRMGEVPTMEVGYVERFRVQKIQQEVYLFLAEKREETAVTSLSVLPRLKVIDKPYALIKLAAPDPFKIYLAIIFLGGVIIPIAIISVLPGLRAIFRKKRKEDSEQTL